MDFKSAGIKYLSPSALNLYRAEPTLWCGRYLYGWKDDAGPKAWVGNAVEAGLHAYLHGNSDGPTSIERPLGFAMNDFENKAHGEITGELDEARDEIEPMLRQACLAMADRFDSKPRYQLKCEHWLDGIDVPMMGYLDFEWPDGGIVDLKTTRSMPGQSKPDHAAQVAFYMNARKQSGSLLYVTPKKHALYPIDDMNVALVPLVQAAHALKSLLALARTKQDAIRIFAPDLNSFYWSDVTREAYRAQMAV